MDATSIPTPPETLPYIVRTIRGWLKDGTVTAPHGTTVCATVPTDYDGSKPLVFVRDDGSTLKEMGISYSSSIAVTVFSGRTGADTTPSYRLATSLFALLAAPGVLPTRVDGPVASVDGATQPVRVSDDHLTGFYMTVDYTTVAQNPNGGSK